jgi:hypothetical protein
LKLFRTNTLFPVVAGLNTLCGGKLRPWASLVYPKAITYKAFPFLNDLEVDTLTDGRSFKGSLTDLAAKATMRAQTHILEGFKAMKARKSEKIFSLTPPSKRRPRAWSRQVIEN